MATHDTLVRTIRTFAPIVSKLTPGLAAHWLARLFSTPSRRPPLSREKTWLASAQRSTVAYDTRITMPVWTWGEGPTVLLVHGWSGRGSQLGVYAAPLVKAGYRVVAFDLPGHGDAGGRISALPIFAAAIERILESVGPVHGVIAHSLGTAAVSMVLSRGLEVERLVYLAPPEDLPRYLRVVGDHLGFHPSIAPKAQARLERKFGALLDDNRGGALAPRLTTPLLIVHDETDREVPYPEGEMIARLWRGSRLMTTNGHGHRRLVRALEVVEAATEFIGMEKSIEEDLQLETLSGV